MNTNEKGFCWPTPEQELLLKAAFLRGEDAIAAWRKWKSTVNFDLMDTDSQRLLPLLYKNLTDHNVQQPEINVYKGFYRMTWYKNRLLVHRITDVLRLLDSHGIPAILLKGAALALLYYKHWALRPMNDFDLFVPQNYALKTVNILCQYGWTPATEMFDESDLMIRHTVHLIDNSGTGFELHWRLIPELESNNADNNFKSGTSLIDFNGFNVSVLSHTDQLFHILVHGARWNYVMPLRWIPDSMMILREASSIIDWNKLLDEARHRSLVTPLKNTLIYLNEVFAAPVPAEIVSSLARMSPSLTERIEFYVYSSSRNILRDICYLWFRYVRTSGVNGSVKLIFNFPSFLRKFWKVPADKSLAFFLIHKLVKRIRNHTSNSVGFNQAT